MGLLDGRVAVVTGGSSGIGKATALAFGREGAKVVVSYNSNAKGGEDTASEIRTAGGEAVYVRADVTKSRDVEALIKCAVETYGRLDCAFNNAGIGQYDGIYAPFTEYGEDVWDKVTTLNLKSVWLCMKYEISQMAKQGRGVIVNTSSIVGIVPQAINIAYASSKAGVNHLSRIAARNYRNKGVRVNVVCPGYIHTPSLEWLAGEMPSGKEILAKLESSGLVGEPKDIAEAVVWLCSDSARFITGHVLVVDGGATLG
jgi:NAD(P)-dependent dehydrogenase (short-subunit alcohol dehydrogenase family)